jgi:hypothetical protein
MSEIVKKQAQPLDNFADFNDSVQPVDGDADQRVGLRLAGILVKFTNEARWETREGTDLTGRELLAANVRRTEVKWGEDAPVEVIELGPGDKYRDLDAVNETVPKSEWREGPDGKPRGPWQRQHVLELVDVATMERFSWPTSTIGGSRAIIELRDRILLMRKFRGGDVYPLVVLADTFMPTRFGGRQRPHLPVKGWVRVGEGSIEPISTAPRPQLMAPVTPAASSQQAPTLQSVSEPTLQEQMGDKVPW